MTTRNRGKEASDDRLFGDPKMQKKLKEGAKDMCCLLSRGFAEKSSLQLVGNRYRLNARQQKALQGMSASKQQILLRAEKGISTDNLKCKTVAIDGFNLLIILESAMSGAYVFKGLDGYYRDVSGVHGTYKRVKKTKAAVLLIGNILQELGVNYVHWYFDAPVSNSGRLKTILKTLAEKYQFPWQILLDNNPDKLLAESDHIVISSDAWILDRAKQNFNLGAYLIENKIPKASIVIAR
ncbi:DUF434 domain-containing protein [Aquimarina sp. 2201CG14-23]|uniref:DUF434 domain-containing protein n=1 Tax=Aquimarina mycalae TaxID=3040073 RepID=UPI0024781371|nr:DUF434 domain-containing protein [Aquimarina sp. 2201CG14-23]MDH7446139.1 DUF434 domain-containing protein [Aquimarina sp. 2201CG14-23]